MPVSPEPLLAVHGARMQFGAVTALDGVSLAVAPGEVLAIMGDNGAGKSTLIRALSGVHRLTAGEVWLEGRPVSFASPAEARAAGIETVFQSLAVFDNLPAAANLFAGREVARGWGGLAWLDERAMLDRARRQLDELQVRVPSLTATLGVMSGGQRQAIACARAAAFASRVVILDEPTAALGLREKRNVWALVRRLADQGTAVILVSHNMEEVLEVASRVAVLRQGRSVGEAPATPENHKRIVSLVMSGRDDA